MIVHVTRTIDADRGRDHARPSSGPDRRIIADFRATMAELKCAVERAAAPARHQHGPAPHPVHARSDRRDADEPAGRRARRVALQRDRPGRPDGGARLIERTRVPEDRRVVLVRIDAGRRCGCSTRPTPCSDDLLRTVLARLDAIPAAGVAQAIADFRAALEADGRPSGSPSDSTPLHDRLRPSRTEPRRSQATPHQPHTEGTDQLMEAFPAEPDDYTPTLDEDPALGLSHRAKMEILFAVMLGLFLGALDQTIVGPALPTIVTQLSRQRLLRLGHHDLPADQHDQRPVLGQAVRHLRPQADLHDRHRHLPGRLGPVRPEPEHGHAHPLPRHPGHRRRRAVPGRARGHRRPVHARRSAASTRACSGPSSASRSSSARSSAAS